MSTLSFVKKNIPVTDLNGENSLPPFGTMTCQTRYTTVLLDEDDGLFVDFGRTPSHYPYRDQDRYTRDLIDVGLDTAVLENEYLRAEFAPSVGGKLWSLIDKVTGRELLFANPVHRPGNLAARNAWTSGGVEWNCGPHGQHHPHTCAWLHTAQLKMDDGTPVLRMYQYERLRNVTYQMDFFLPDGSKVLFCRMRIVNDNPYMTPMYWWSNIAVPEDKNGRVIMDTVETYTNRGGKLSKTSVPIAEGIDITYPTNNPVAIDFFWKLPDHARRYVCQLDKNGYGLMQCSTSRLKGRKLFVWGQGPGGDRWQNYLSADDCPGRYVEIQAGLAATQYESLPMPPHTAWEWIETYGAFQADPAKVHGEWDGARAEVNARLDEMVDAAYLEKLLADTHKMATSPAEKVIYSGGGWGALEALRRNVQGVKPSCEHLDFGALEAEQEPWKALLEGSSFGDQCACKAPISYILQPEWTELVEKAVRGADSYNWYAWYMLGTIRMAEARLNEAREALERSMELKPSAWALYCLAQLKRIDGCAAESALMIMKAAQMSDYDISLVREALRTLNATEQYRAALNFAAGVPAAQVAVPRNRLNIAMAYIKLGDIENAEKLLWAEGGMVVADIREGEVSVTELWFLIEEAKAKRDGRTFDREEAEVPLALDFRMGAKRKEKKA
ncbi:MAG: DUF5107 domain-containing protein [Clostridia bacterium]|nr:DUF5107 domain-containing protein [Clostridia bacterium]